MSAVIYLLVLGPVEKVFRWKMGNRKSLSKDSASVLNVVKQVLKLLYMSRCTEYRFIG